MCSRLSVAAVMACMLAISGAGEAQTMPGDVTFELPLNLTRMSLDIRKVTVTCNIMSAAIRATQIGRTTRQKLAQQVEYPVAAGRLVTTANIVISIPPGVLDNPTGKTANYECMLMGYSSKPNGGWDRFDEKHVNASFRLSPTPMPITGSFDW